mmetsp:Transcript_28680/g.80166  ORF Transcript_28680/g.80166 Transcript_28680/m.80166 type:complete len:305 (+) Transcript_28680:471-1385(+)
MVAECDEVALLVGLVHLDLNDAALHDETAVRVGQVLHPELLLDDLHAGLLLRLALGLVDKIYHRGHALVGVLQLRLIGVVRRGVLDQLPQEQRVFAEALDRLDEVGVEEQTVTLGVRVADVKELGEVLALALAVFQKNERLVVVGGVDRVEFKVVKETPKYIADNHIPQHRARLARLLHTLLHLLVKFLVDGLHIRNVGEYPLHLARRQHPERLNGKQEHVGEDAQVTEIVLLRRHQLLDDIPPHLPHLRRLVLGLRRRGRGLLRPTLLVAALLLRQCGHHGGARPVRRRLEHGFGRVQALHVR